MPVDPKFIIELKGKSFVLLGGLLELAHEKGVHSIQTELVPELCVPAENRFVVKAIGRFPNEDDKNASSVWTAYGDASPGNSQMRGAELRHAETRAIARMLRWATNCPTTAFEELGPDPSPETAPTPPPHPTALARPTRAPRAAPVPPVQPTETPDTALDPHCSWKGCEQPLSAAELAQSTAAAGRPLCPPHLELAKALPRCSECNVVVSKSTAEQTTAAYGRSLCARHAHERDAAVTGDETP